MSPLHRVTDGRLKVSAIIPGLRVQYTIDNGQTWRDISDETLLSQSVKIWHEVGTIDSMTSEIFLPVLMQKPRF